MDPKNIRIEDFDYPLPDERIARFPLKDRDRSKLLVFRDSRPATYSFHQLPEVLPPDAHLVFNDTKVIHARIHFTLPNGKPLEILCLEPEVPADHQLNLSGGSPVVWKCLIGGNRRWKSGEITRSIVLGDRTVRLTAQRTEALEDAFLVTFSWDHPGLSFGELLAAAGIIPLPPYLKREAEAADNLTYQTVYARTEGSVAAPTAGLHFTDQVLSALSQRGHHTSRVTLHVGAGTFRPVKTDTIGDHAMHQESVFFTRDTIAGLLDALKARQTVIAVGTTSTRSLESLYWHGCRLAAGQADAHLDIDQWVPYSDLPAVPAVEALERVLERMQVNDIHQLEGHTRLIIAPGYQYRMIKGLITNFHQPKSTLLLLVAALIGDSWKEVYRYALENDFRFLSYGDSSLLMATGAI